MKYAIATKKESDELFKRRTDDMKHIDSLVGSIGMISGAISDYVSNNKQSLLAHSSESSKLNKSIDDANHKIGEMKGSLIQIGIHVQNLLKEIQDAKKKGG